MERINIEQMSKCGIKNCNSSVFEPNVKLQVFIYEAFHQKVINYLKNYQSTEYLLVDSYVTECEFKVVDYFNVMFWGNKWK